MLQKQNEQEFSGAADIWKEFVARHPEMNDEGFLGVDAVLPDQFRDEYVRLPYDEVACTQECHW